MSGSTMPRISQRLVVVVIVAFIAMFLFPPWVGVRGSFAGYAFLWNPESPSDSISWDRLAIQIVLVVAFAALSAVLRADSPVESKLRAMVRSVGSKLIGVARAILPAQAERLPVWRRLAWLLIAAWMAGAAYTEVQRAKQMADLQRSLLPPNFNNELGASEAERSEVKQAIRAWLESNRAIGREPTLPLSQADKDEVMIKVIGPALAKYRGFSFVRYPSIQALRDDWVRAGYQRANKPTDQVPYSESETDRPPTLGEARFCELLPEGAEDEDRELMRSPGVSAIVAANDIALGQAGLTVAIDLPSLIGWPIQRRGFLLTAFLGIAIVSLGHAVFGRLVVRDSAYGCVLLCLMIVISLTWSVYAPAR